MPYLVSRVLAFPFVNWLWHIIDCFSLCNPVKQQERPDIVTFDITPLNKYGELEPSYELR